MAQNPHQHVDTVKDNVGEVDLSAWCGVERKQPLKFCEQDVLLLSTEESSQPLVLQQPEDTTNAPSII